MKIPDFGQLPSRLLLGLMGLLVLMRLAEIWISDVYGVVLTGFLAAVVFYLVWNGWIRKRPPEGPS